MSTRASVSANISDSGSYRVEPEMEKVKEENEILKAKLQSCSTINTFFHETRTEIALLSRKISVKDSIIADLKLRLGRYESMGVQLNGEEPVVFGPSKSLVENLCKEIAKLKQKLKDSEIKAAQQSETSKLEIERLQRQVSAQEQEATCVMRRPEHEKDGEIQRLRSALADRDRAQATRTVLCDSLAEEAEQLRSQLGATVRVCQELQRRLEKEKEASSSADAYPESPPGRKFMDPVTAPQFSALECKLQEENQALKQRVAYVESLNAKWQKYDSSREEYVKDLCQKLKELSSPAALGLGPANMGLMQQEIGRLNRLLQEKMSDCARLGRELEDSKKADRERIQMLEQQVLTYVDDFNSERADRERAQSRIQDLQEEVARLRGQDFRDLPASFRTHHSSPHTSPRLHGDVTNPLLRSSSEQPGANRLSSPPTQGSPRSEQRAPTDLQCPRCHTPYDDDHTEEYLRHCAECARL